MNTYHVHIYREMRLYFPGVEAQTPEQAAELAANKPSEDAQCLEDCDGANLAALVDVHGNDEYQQSVTVDFEPECLRKAVPVLREALAWLATAAEDLDAAMDGATDQFDPERAELQNACCNARQADARINLSQSISRSKP